MVDPVVFQKLMDVSFRFVSFRPRSKKEITSALHVACKKRHITDISIVDVVLSRLTELGYVDDLKFATWWILQRNQFRPKGWRALSFELSQKGVERSIIEACKPSLEADGIDDVSLATTLATKVLGKSVGLSVKEQKMKLYGYLTRRGFEGSVVSRVVDAVLNTGYNTDTT